MARPAGAHPGTSRKGGLRVGALDVDEVDLLDLVDRERGCGGVLSDRFGAGGLVQADRADGPVQEAADRHGNPTMRALVRYARAEALLETEPDAAHAPLEEAIDLARKVDNRMVLGVADVSLVGLLSRHAADTDRALATFPSVIERLRRAGDWTHLWTGLRGLVELLAPVARSSAAVLLGAMRGAATAPPVYGEDARRLAVVRDELEDALGREQLDAATARGRAMADHEATDLALTAIERCLATG